MNSKNMTKTKRDFRSFDFVLFGAVLVMCIIGIVLIGSATNIDSGVLSREYTNQRVWFASGILVMLLAAFVDYRFMCRFYIPIYVVNILLLVVVLVIGKVFKLDFSREIRVGPVGIMPSEFAKLFMIIFLSTLIDKYAEKINKLPVLLLIGLLGFIPFVLIAAQPSLSASLVILVILATLLFIGKISYKYIILAVAIILPLIAFIYYDINSENHIIVDKLFQGYQLSNRLLPYFQPEMVEGEVTQNSQAIYAIGSGGLLGQGLYNNRVLVPQAKNDFIFSVLGAEFGFVGCLAVLGLMLFIIIKCFIISLKSDVFIGRLIAGGVGMMFAFQVFVNVGVNTGLLPNTGMAFPFLSTGGSTMWINMCLVGLVINVSMTKTRAMFDGD